MHIPYVLNNGVLTKLYSLVLCYIEDSVSINKEVMNSQLSKLVPAVYITIVLNAIVQQTLTVKRLIQLIHALRYNTLKLSLF